MGGGQRPPPIVTIFYSALALKGSYKALKSFIIIPSDQPIPYYLPISRPRAPASAPQAPVPGGGRAPPTTYKDLNANMSEQFYGQNNSYTIGNQAIFCENTLSQTHEEEAATREHYVASDLTNSLCLFQIWRRIDKKNVHNNF